MEKESTIASNNFEKRLRSFPISNYLTDLPKTSHHCTFENFDFNGQNKLLAEALVEFIEDTLEKQGLFLFGKYGTGKTHLAVSTYRALVYKLNGISDIFFTNVPALLRDCVLGVGKIDENYIRYVGGYRYLFLDDIAAKNYKSDEIDALRQVLMNLYENKKVSFIITSNLPVGELDSIGLIPHTISRLFEMCFPLMLEGEDRRYGR